MIFLKLLLSSGLMFIAETAFILNESSLCYQPSKYIKPHHYNIKFIFYIEENSFYGEYRISISIINKTQNILLNNIYSDELHFHNIVLLRNLEQYENAKYTVSKSTFDIKKDIINVSFEDELLPGNYNLYIKYDGFTDKVFRILDVKEKFALVAATNFHIIGSQELSSCWDQQNLLSEATFNISIACNQCTVLSNMPLRITEKYKDNMLLTHFDTTSAISLYHAAIVVSSYPLRVYDIRNRYIQMWCSNKSAFYIEFAKKVAAYITMFWNHDWLQRLNNIPKITHVAIPNFLDNDITVLGLIFYNEMDIVYDKNLYPVARKIEVSRLVGHKVTQQWFYNQSNPFGLTFSFNKALTTLLATYAVDLIYHNNQTINLFVVQNQHTSFLLDDYSMWNSTSQDDNLLKIRESIRAPCILRMMQHAVTDEIFWKAVRLYTNSTQIYRQSFMTSLEKVVADAIKLDISYIIDISIQTMKYWTLEEHCPIIKIERDYNSSWNRMHISIQNYDILKIDCLPVTFTTQTYPNFDDLTEYNRIMVCKSTNSYSVYLYDNGWLIVNIQQIGYYRVNYNDENWRRISDYLNSDNFMKIHVLNRAQIIDDAFHLAIAGQLNVSIFWNITSYLRQEDDYIAWYPMFKALEYMFSTFPVLEEETKIFAKRIRAVLKKVLRKIKYEEIDDTDEFRIMLRQEAARWACFLGEITCMKEANNKLKQHLQDPIKHRLLPWWTAWTYCRGLMITTMNELTFRSVYIMGLKRTDLKFSEYLACIGDNNLIKDYLSFKQYTHTKQEDQFLANTFLHFITKHAKNPIILTYLLDNFNEIKPKNVNIIAALIIMINNVHFENALLIRTHSDSIVEANVIEVNTEDEYIRHRIKEMSDRVIDKDELYSYIIIQVEVIRKKQIEKQRQYFARFFF